MHRPQKKRFCELSNFQVFSAESYCDLPKTCAAGITEKELLAAVQYLAIEKPNLWYCGRDSGIKLFRRGFLWSNELVPPSFVQCCKASVLDEPPLAQYRFCSPSPPLTPPLPCSLNMSQYNFCVFQFLRLIPSPSRLWVLLEVEARKLQQLCWSSSYPWCTDLRRNFSANFRIFKFSVQRVFVICQNVCGGDNWKGASSWGSIYSICYS